MELFPAQQKTVALLDDTLKRYKGAVLRGEEGTGKTLMASTIAESYEKVLWVCPAFAIKDLRAKIDECELDVDIDLISYNGFGNVNKISAKDMKQYDLMIFDECHNLRNYKASWTTRFVRLRGPQQYLFLSGTPLLKSPLDFMYVLRKCGLWAGKSTNDFKIRYFGAKPSKFGDFLEVGEFQNATCFQTQVDKVTAVIKHKDIDANMPNMNLHFEHIEGDYERPKDITKETTIRKEYGLRKVPQVAKRIKEIRRGNSQTRVALTLCHFHDTARRIHAELGGTLCLTPKRVAEAIEDAKFNGGHIVTTLGLTSSSYNFNECNTVFMVESTYSFPLDRQSINRCRRIGKVDEVDVYYFAYPGEAPLLKSFQRQYLTESVGGHAKMGPSKLSRLEKCPGSYWLPDTLTRKDYIEIASMKGTKNHEALERYINDPNADLDHAPREIVECVKYCRKQVSKADKSGVEVKVHAKHIHEELWGTADFFSYDAEKEKLIVLDYKNGSAPVAVEDNLQLQAYSAMISHTYKLPVKTLTTIIFQKNKMKHCTYRKNVIPLIEERLQIVVDKIAKAKKDPIAYLNKGKCDFFCTARAYHDQQPTEEIDMAKKGKKKTVHAIESAYVTFKKIDNDKAGNEKLTLGLSFKEIPATVKRMFAKGKPGHEVVKEKLAAHPEYGSRSIFASNRTEWLNDDVLAVEKGDRVYVEVTAAVTEPSEKHPRENLFWNLKTAEVLAEDNEDDFDS